MWKRPGVIIREPGSTLQNSAVAIRVARRRHGYLNFRERVALQ